ncbi:MAG: TolC family protein [Rhodobacteraceae bacterium]|nr:TolC family protein [Paracoccaceae bacterium]
MEKAEAVAIAKHPRILGAQFQAKAAEIALQSSNKNRQPQIDASLTHTLADTRRTGSGYTNNSVTADITGQMTWYAGDKLNSARRRALANFERSQSNLQLQGYLTRQSLRNAFTGWQVARASIVSGREQVRAAQVAFEGVREEAKLGARTTLDALDAEQEVLTARSNLVAAIRNEYLATYSVLSEMGLLTAQHLKLGVPIYNPDVNYAKVTKNQANPLGLKRLKIFDKLKKRKSN